jgi:hypothetical protein
LIVMPSRKILNSATVVELLAHVTCVRSSKSPSLAFTSVGAKTMIRNPSSQPAADAPPLWLKATTQ